MKCFEQRTTRTAWTNAGEMGAAGLVPSCAFALSRVHGTRYLCFSDPAFCSLHQIGPSIPGQNIEDCLYQLSERLARTGQTETVEEIKSERSMQMSLRKAIGDAVEHAHDAGLLVFGEIKASILAQYAMDEPLDETAIDLAIIQEASRRSLPLRFETTVEMSLSDGLDENSSPAFYNQILTS